MAASEKPPKLSCLSTPMSPMAIPNDTMNIPEYTPLS